MSQTRNLLYSIAEKMKRPKTDMMAFIQTLQANWFDTKQSLKSLKKQDYEKFKIPLRVATLISEQLNLSLSSENNSKMQIESQVQYQLAKLKKSLNEVKFQQVVGTLLRIFINIRDNITQEKYRILKKSNEKIKQLFQYKQIWKIASYGGFEQTSTNYVLNNINLSRIDECVQMVAKQHQSSKFNPYQAQITSTTGRNSFQNVPQEQSSTIFNQKLQQLQRQRERIMSKPIKDRAIKIYQVQSSQNQRKQYQNVQQKQLNEDQVIYMQNIKEMLKNHEDPKFMNRRKQEYYDLLKKPCFSETLVKVKLPQNYIFQCVFSPMEKIQILTQIFHEFVEDQKLSYYLYMTPPVQRLEGKILKENFYDLGCVPSAVFYFGSEIKNLKNPLKLKKRY